MFPVNSSGREEKTGVSPSPGGDQRVVLGEVDFFAEKKTPINAVVKKENSHGEDRTCRDLDVNTGLQLVTANTGSDQSTMDDGMSCDAEDNKAKYELAQLQVELERMNAENQRLRGMLTQMTNNYSALQLHLVTVQQQQNSRTDSTQEQEITDRKSEEKKQETNGGPIVPRQFLTWAPLPPTRRPNNNPTPYQKKHFLDRLAATWNHRGIR
jgi:hypothetical protein